MYAVRVDEDDAVGECVDLLRAYDPLQLSASGMGLEGGEIESSLLVALDHPLDRRVAEVADTVEEDDGTVVGHLGSGSSRLRNTESIRGPLVIGILSGPMPCPEDAEGYAGVE